MIKLNKLYSNKKEIFPDITFRDGLNVVFASVSKNITNNASHSLGKTTLIDVINFCLLKQIDKHHILKKECFTEFVFYLEIQCETEKYVTIKRPAIGQVSITETTEPFRETSEEEQTWLFDKLALKKAKTKLDQLICPKSISTSGFTYRNGLRYCFRNQTQYENTFRVNNSREDDSRWAPYLASIIGINAKTVDEKYKSNKRIESLKNAIKEIQNIPTESGQSLEAEITQIEASVRRMKVELDKFDFKRSDENVSEELINEVSENVSSMVSQVYSLDQKISAINKSLNTEFSFEIDKVLELFKEVEIFFPSSLEKSYNDLINLNKDMSIGRKERLVKTKKKILGERKTIKENLDSERSKQQTLSKILVQKDAFEKYKQLQNRLIDEETRVAVLKERLEKIDLASELKDKLKNEKNEQDTVAKELEKETKVRGNIQLTKAVTIFSEIVDKVLNFSAFFYTETNKEGNIQFKIGLQDQTSVNEGFSYTRALSAIFDITLLILHSNSDFYRFCYHDGLLESLDDRLKLKLISEWRQFSTKHSLQFIITVLDSDLPLIDDKKEYFSDDEIIRELHDRGDDGRLFKMPAF